MIDPRNLLTDYAENGSESAFRELVARYLDLVFSTAVRLVDGDTHRAEDIAQTVFADLARRATTLSPDVMLGGWLHRRTCHAAATLMRSERRRRKREWEAAEMDALEREDDTGYEPVAPVLDDAINQLRAEDRAALILRYFEGRDLRAVGEALGSNEDAAQKRVARALEKLRVLLAQRGVTASVAGLATVLGAHAVSAAPAGLVTTVSSAALAGSATGATATFTFLKLMTLTQMKVAGGIAVAAGLGTALVLEQQAWSRLRNQNEALEQQVAALRQSAAAPPNVPDPVARPGVLAAPREDQAQELERLRREVGALRQEPTDLPRLQAENRELKAMTEEPDDPLEAEFMEDTRVRVEHLKQWGLSFLLYAHRHDGRVPESFEEAASIQGSEELLEFDTNHFEIVYRGTFEGVVDPGKTLIFRERQARQSPNGEWVKVYGLADGSTVTHMAADEEAFETWENERLSVHP
jgi:RNA polymerase sigma factor (sigma-70 family)